MIEKLGKDNFDSWKLQILSLGLNDKEATSGRSTADEKKCLQGDQKARADIIFATNSSELCHIKHCVTSNTVWNKLKYVYESREPAKKAILFNQLLF